MSLLPRQGDLWNRLQVLKWPLRVLAAISIVGTLLALNLFAPSCDYILNWACFSANPLVVLALWGNLFWNILAVFDPFFLPRLLGSLVQRIWSKHGLHQSKR
ncbi:MAG: hypothetical protein Q7R47_06650 [Candidatus Diapherotrites archaeon]|nr:hypothetical protein [Candidatus Diapherotrites archaeon]